MDSRPAILIVDDHRSIRDPLATYLRRFDFDVQAVGDGKAMRERLTQRDFSLIVLDVMLSVLSCVKVGSSRPSQSAADAVAPGWKEAVGPAFNEGAAATAVAYARPTRGNGRGRGAHRRAAGGSAEGSSPAGRSLTKDTCPGGRKAPGACVFGASLVSGGRYRDRTCDPSRVKAVLYR